MQSIDELNGLMISVIDGVSQNASGVLSFSDDARVKINEIAEYARGTAIYAEGQSRREEFEATPGLTADKAYVYMLDRVVNAPTSLHRDGSVLMLMPTIATKLADEKNR